VVGRGELTDAAWAVIAPLLPRTGGRGKPWADHRRVISGILWKLRTGAPGRDLPARYGPWDRLLAHAQTKSDAVGEVEWEASLDSTTVRAHQHAAGARKRPAAGEKGGPRRARTRGSGAAAGG